MSPASISAEPLAIPPEYGLVADERRVLLDWSTVAARLAAASHYWIVTVRADGRPHAVPTDGLWLGDDRFYFGGSPRTVKHRNLVGNPNATLHLEDASAVLVVEGTCAVETPSAEQAAELSVTSKQKYGYGPPPDTYLAGVWVLTPAKAMAWSDITTDATRFVFE